MANAADDEPVTTLFTLLPLRNPLQRPLAAASSQAVESLVRCTQNPEPQLCMIRFAEDLSGEGFRYVHEFYTASPGSVSTAASVPVLWDRRSRRIVSNDSGDIATMFATEFEAFVRCGRQSDTELRMYTCRGERRPVTPPPSRAGCLVRCPELDQATVWITGQAG